MMPNRHIFCGARPSGDFFTSKAKVLSRPDTLYLFAHCAYNREAAQVITEVVASLATPKTRDLLTRINALCATMDPSEEARFRALPWPEMVEELKAIDGCPLDDRDLTAAPICLAGRHFSVLPWSPRRGCTFQLQADGITVHGAMVAPRPNLPNFYLEIGSGPLWMAHDWRRYLLNWQSWLHEISDNKPCACVSRVDLANHTQALSTSDIDPDRFVCRGETRGIYRQDQLLVELKEAHEKDQYSRQTGHPASSVTELIAKWENETGMSDVLWRHGHIPQMTTFGKRGRLYARIYNKTREIAKNAVKRALFTEVYKAAGFIEGKNVINVEFEISRAWLQSRELVIFGQTIQINTLADLLQHYTALSGYLLGTSESKGWLRMIDPESATRIERCDTATAWELMREMTEFLPYISAQDRSREMVRRSAASHVPGLVRVVARMNAHLGLEMNPEEITLNYCLERMAMLAHSEFVKRGTALSDDQTRKSYMAESARVTFNHQQGFGPLQPLGARESA